MTGLLSRFEDSHFLAGICNVALEPYSSFLDTHVDIETLQITLLLLSLKPRLNEISDLLIIGHTYDRHERSDRDRDSKH
jgi:hypothetical protein